MRIESAKHELLNLVTPLVDTYRQVLGQPSDIDGVHHYLEGVFRDHSSEMFVAIADEGELQKAVGFIMLDPVFAAAKLRAHWMVTDLYVKDAYRNQGVGESLMQKALDTAAAAEGIGVMAQLPRRVSSVSKFLEKMGFHEVPESVPHWYSFKNRA